SAVPLDSAAVIDSDQAAAGTGAAGAVRRQRDRPVRRRRSISVGHLAGDARRPDELQHEADVERFLADAERYFRRIDHGGDAGVVGRRVGDRLFFTAERGAESAAEPAASLTIGPRTAGSAEPAASEDRRAAEAAGRRGDVVVAGHQPPDAVLPLVVGLAA